MTYNTRSNATIHRDIEEKIHCTKKRNFKTPTVNTTHFGLKTLRRIGPIIWSFALEEMKNATSLNAFKKQIKELEFDKCS